VRFEDSENIYSSPEQGLSILDNRLDGGLPFCEITSHLLFRGKERKNEELHFPGKRREMLGTGKLD